MEQIEKKYYNKTETIKNFEEEKIHLDLFIYNAEKDIVKIPEADGIDFEVGYFFDMNEAFWEKQEEMKMKFFQLVFYSQFSNLWISTTVVIISFYPYKKNEFLENGVPWKSSYCAVF